MGRAWNQEIDDHAGEVHRRDLARVIRVIVIVAIVAALVVVAVDNREDTRLGYVFGDVSSPVWLVILAAGLLGTLVGWLIRHRPRR
jgi:uncharacterized integral membrane protein